MTRYGGTNAKRHRMICLCCQHKYNKAHRKNEHQGLHRGRYTLRRHPDKYVIAKYRNCPHCGSDEVRSDEKNRRAEVLKQDTCGCTQIPFPHRRGMHGCDHWEGEWTEDDQIQFEGMLSTPRSG